MDEPEILTVGNIQIQFDSGQANAPIRWRMADAVADGGPEGWQPTPYQTADAGHRVSDATELVTQWLKSQ